MSAISPSGFVRCWGIFRPDLPARPGFFVGANSFAKQAEGLPTMPGAATQPSANEFAPTVVRPPIFDIRSD
ncbi:hypothetical protein E8F06_22115 [Pseudomonas sp. BN411]|nr:hypothetical protein [Pseudomonas sp. BN411]